MRKIAIVLLVIFVIMLSSWTVYAASSQDQLFPSSDKMGVNSSQEKEFEKYELINYRFDTEEFDLFDIWPRSLAGMTNIVFTIHVYISRGVASLLMLCFEVDLFNSFSGFIDSIIGALQESVFNPLLSVLLVIGGIVIVFNIATRRNTTAFKVAVNILLVLTIAFAFFNSPSYFMKKVNDLSGEISGEVLKGTARVITNNRNLTADDAIVQLGNNYWNAVVRKPWELIQFGSVAEGEAKGDQFLSLPYGSEDRIDLTKKELKTNGSFSKSGVDNRLAMVCLFGIVLLVMNIAIALLAAMGVLFQVGALLLAMMAVIVFPIALIPGFSIRVVEKWFFRTSGFMLFKIAITILISAYFAISVVLYRLSNVYGWFLMAILQIIVVIAIIIFRNQILDTITGVAKGEGAVVSAVERQKQAGEFSRKLFTKAGYIYGAKKLYSGIKDMREQRADEKMTQEYRPLAKDYLVQKYNREKKEAEKRAHAEGREVQSEDYSDFVRRTDFRIDKGFSAFDESDINSSVEYMKSLKKQGEDPRNILTTKIQGQSDNTIKYRQIAMESEARETKEKFISDKTENATKIKKNIMANRESELYDRKVASQVKKGKEQFGESSNAQDRDETRIPSNSTSYNSSEHEETVTSVNYTSNRTGMYEETNMSDNFVSNNTGEYDETKTKVKSSSNNIRLFDEMRKEKQEKEYRQRKKEETNANREAVASKAPITVEEFSSSVNGSNEKKAVKLTRRPTGSNAINNLKVEGGEIQDVEKTTVIRVNEKVKVMRNQTVESSETTNYTVNKNHTISSQSERIPDQRIVLSEDVLKPDNQEIKIKPEETRKEMTNRKAKRDVEELKGRLDRINKTKGDKG